MDEELLTRIDEVIKISPDLKPAIRFTLTRAHKLGKLQRNLRAYRDNLTDMLLTIRSMETSLDREIQMVKDRS